MKTRKTTLIFAALLAILMIGAGVILVLSQKPVGGKVTWVPRYYTLDAMAPDPFDAEVQLKGGHKAQTEINATTILLEGLYSPSADPYPKLHGPRLVVPFSGPDVKDALLPKLPTHLGVLIPGKYRVPLEISGLLYTGETFIASGVITVTVPEPPPP